MSGLRTAAVAASAPQGAGACGTGARAGHGQPVDAMLAVPPAAGASQQLAAVQQGRGMDHWRGGGVL